MKKVEITNDFHDGEMKKEKMEKEKMKKEKMKKIVDDYVGSGHYPERVAEVLDYLAYSVAQTAEHLRSNWQDKNGGKSADILTMKLDHMIGWVIEKYNIILDEGNQK